MSNVRAAKRRTQAGKVYEQGLFHGYTKEWHKIFTIIPRRTISGKLCVGSVYRKVVHSYYNDYMGFGPESVEYATEKQLFTTKLLGM